ncbi:hypothetical protein Q1695_003117 [Nippostrongylus brasiliensis]|nr:hypothetical protein Q1695_003117 [Nippostrongylus brasiliensis]
MPLVVEFWAVIFDTQSRRSPFFELTISSLTATHRRETTTCTSRWRQLYPFVALLEVGRGEGKLSAQFSTTLSSQNCDSEDVACLEAATQLP